MREIMKAMVVLVAVAVVGCAGQAGPEGQKGANGAQGSAGADGYSALLTTRAADAADCPNGGTVISAGIDNGDGGGTAGDGVMQAGEIDSTVNVCNGAAGANGQAGADGQDGTDGADGQDGTDGQDGADGQAGDAGANGHSALISNSAATLSACPSGGTHLEVGVDLNDDGQLTADEVTSAFDVCNGAQVVNVPAGGSLNTAVHTAIAQGASIVQLPAGTVTVNTSDALNITSALTIAAPAGAGTTVELTATDNSQRLFTIGAGGNLTLVNLAIDASDYQNRGGSPIAIEVTAGGSLTLDHVTIDGARETDSNFGLQGSRVILVTDGNLTMNDSSITHFGKGAVRVVSNAAAGSNAVPRLVIHNTTFDGARDAAIADNQQSQNLITIVGSTGNVDATLTDNHFININKSGTGASGAGKNSLSGTPIVPIATDASWGYAIIWFGTPDNTPQITGNTFSNLQGIFAFQGTVGGAQYDLGAFVADNTLPGNAFAASDTNYVELDATLDGETEDSILRATLWWAAQSPSQTVHLFPGVTYTIEGALDDSEISGVNVDVFGGTGTATLNLNGNANTFTGLVPATGVTVNYGL